MSQPPAKTIDDRRAAEIAGDACWFPFNLDVRDGTFTFVRTDEETLAALPFVARTSWNIEGLPTVNLSIAQTLAHWPEQPPPPTNFVWHTGFCSSTLLTRALDRHGRNLSLREPEILATLGDIKRARLLGESQYRRLPQTVLGLLSRPLAAGSRMMIKPAPPSPTLIPEAARLTTGKMLFLYIDCSRFLIGVARGGEPRRAFIRRTFSNIVGDGHVQNTWSATQLFGLSDLQIAALVWHMLLSQFRRNMQTLGTRAASLDCEALVCSPRETLEKLDHFFGLELGLEHVEETMNGPLFGRHAKTGDEVNNPHKLWAREGQVTKELADDIREIVAWSYDACGAQSGQPLPNPLVEVDKSYGP